MSSGSATPFVIRVAGLPQEALALAATPATSAAINHILMLTDTQRRLADAVSGALHAHIGRTDDVVVRRQLLRLRRALWNGRLTEYESAVGKVAGALSGGTVELLNAWQETTRRRAAAVESAELTSASELRELAGRLRTALRSDGLAGEISRLAPSLAAALDKEDSCVSAEAVGAAFNFVTRAAGKTTPRAGLASWGLGFWQPAPPGQPARWNGRARERRGNTELNTAITERLSSAITTRALLADTAPVRVNPSLVRTEGQVCFIAPGPPEGVLRLRATPALDTILRETSRQRVSLGEIARSSAEHLAMDVQPVLEYVLGLVARGALCVQSPVADQSPDHLTELIIMQQGISDPCPATALLTTLRDGVHRHGVGDPRWPLPRLRAALDQLHEDFRWPDAARSAAAGPLVFKDSVLTGATFSLDPAGWSALGTDLSVLAGLARQLDPLAGARSTAAQALISALGADPVSLPDGLRYLLSYGGEHAKDEDQARAQVSALCRALPVTLPPPGLAVEQARDALARAIGEQDGTDEVAVDPAALAPVTGPGPEQPPASVAFFGHPCVMSGSPAFVLNSVEAGYGRTASHVRRLLGRVGGESDIPPHRWPAPWMPPSAARRDPLYVTLPATAGSNVNLRDPGPLPQLDYPGVNPEPDATLIVSADLDIVCGPVGPMLRHRPDGRQVIVVPQGRMADFYFPPVMRLLLRLFGPTAQIPLQSSLAVFSAPDARGIRRLPRVRCGQLVLFRAAQLVPATAIPALGPQETVLSQLLELEAWRRANRIPATAYVRAIGDQAVRTKWRKPTYVDFRSALCVRLLSRLPLQSSDFLLIHEVLPQPADIPPDQGGERYACEAVLECDA